MTSPARALDEKDLTVLQHYADAGNRELYWNYLAQLPGNDGYGLLALGVVRNDNMPGATANAYAQNYAQDHNGKVLTEREWDDFGVDLVRRDFLHRKIWASDPDHPEYSLNLPARGVRPGREVTVAMDTPAPPKEQSIALAGGLDQQIFEQSQQQAQQMAMQQEGPVMRL